jgi:hypothetical protein
MFVRLLLDCLIVLIIQKLFDRPPATRERVASPSSPSAAATYAFLLLHTLSPPSTRELSGLAWPPRRLTLGMAAATLLPLVGPPQRPGVCSNV